MRRIPLLLTALASLGLSCAVAPAGAATGLGGVSVAPASIDAEVRAGSALPPISVSNDTGRRVLVRAFVVPASQDLSGLPAFELGAASRRSGRSLATVSPARFALPAAGARSVSVRVRDPEPRTGAGSYGVVVFEAVRGGDGTTDEGSVVDARLRLTTNLLLTYPGKVRRTGEIVSLRAEQGPAAPARTLRFVARVRNPGRIHVRPTAVLRVRDDAGRLVTRAGLTPGNVLPGADREFPVVVRKLLPAGRYTARVTVQAGRRRSTRTVAFELVGPNELPTPALRVASLSTPDDADAGGTRTRLTVINRGTAPGTPRGEVILATAGGRRLARRPLRLGVVRPGARARTELRLPGVTEGPHRLTVRLLDGDRELDARTVVFTPGTAPGLWSRALDWAATHVPLLLGAFAALLLGVTLSVGLYVRRLRRTVVAVVSDPSARRVPGTPAGS
ncbi:hypothetical protein [Paraconexibacter sp.]|uniref:hypothetical protein n=1 Tax=Paraconexibacter sp. TaxID=2949640 RepID=UPI003566B369